MFVKSAEIWGVFCEVLTTYNIQVVCVNNILLTLVCKLVANVLLTLTPTHILAWLRYSDHVADHVEQHWIYSKYLSVLSSHFWLCLHIHISWKMGYWPWWTAAVSECPSYLFLSLAFFKILFNMGLCYLSIKITAFFDKTTASRTISTLFSI